jgi:hypothetical protein
MVKLNKAQQISLKRKWIQDDQGMTYKEFRKSAQQGWDCIMVHWSGMWLGIETDGYTHS